MSCIISKAACFLFASFVLCSCSLPTKTSQNESTYIPFVTTSPAKDSNDTNTGYGDVQVGASKNVDVRKLQYLRAIFMPFTTDTLFLSFAQPLADDQGIFPVAMAVKISREKYIDKKTPAMIAVITYLNCTYSMEYMGKDENEYEYFEGIANNPVKCNHHDILRIEKRNAQTLRISGHDPASGVEQWAGVFYGRPIQSKSKKP